jgi:hypothetical protein
MRFFLLMNFLGVSHCISNRSTKQNNANTQKKVFRGFFLFFLCLSRTFSHFLLSVTFPFSVSLPSLSLSDSSWFLLYCVVFAFVLMPVFVLLLAVLLVFVFGFGFGFAFELVFMFVSLSLPCQVCYLCLTILFCLCLFSCLVFSGSKSDTRQEGVA